MKPKTRRFSRDLKQRPEEKTSKNDDDEIGNLLSEKYSAANRLFGIDLATLHTKIESRKNAHKVKQE